MFFFFFQAEDGIRDKLVTGVQTCALPIWLRVRSNVPASFFESRHDDGHALLKLGDIDLFHFCHHDVRLVPMDYALEHFLFNDDFAKTTKFLRSEERRVGKECRLQMWTSE